MTPPQLANLLDTPKWMVITSHHYWEKLRTAGQWAFPDKALTKANEIKPGDIAVVYLTQDGGESSLGGLIRFTGAVRTEKPQGFFGTLYPHRIDMEVVLAAKPPVPIRPLIANLGFVTNKQNWGLHFQGHPLRPLPPGDAQLMLQSLQVTT